MEIQNQKIERIFYGQDTLSTRIPCHTPNDLIEIFIKKGNYRVDLSKARFIYRPILKFQAGYDDRGLLLNDELSCFQVQSVEFDSVPLLKNQGSRSRPIFRAFQNRIIQQTKAQNNPFDYNSQKWYYNQPQTNSEYRGYNEGLIYTGIYDQNYTQRVELLSRFYTPDIFDINAMDLLSNQTSQSPNAFNVGVGTNELYTWLSPKLSEIANELKNMTDVDMSLFTDGIKIVLELVEPKYALSFALPTLLIDGVFQSLSTDSYVLTDTVTTFKKMKLQPIISQNQPLKYSTYQYEVKDIHTNTIQFDWLNFNAKSYRGCVIIFTGRGWDINEFVEQDQQNYQGDEAFNSPAIEYNSTHFFLPYSEVELQVDATSFKPLGIPITNYQRASYISAIDGFEYLFPNQQYNASFKQFINNKFAIVIPVSEEGVNVDNKRVSLHINFAEQGLHASKLTDTNTSKYQAHVFHLCDGEVMFQNGEIKVSV